jgi:hypothetical protein
MLGAECAGGCGGPQHAEQDHKAVAVTGRHSIASASAARPRTRAPRISSCETHGGRCGIAPPLSVSIASAWICTVGVVAETGVARNPPTCGAPLPTSTMRPASRERDPSSAKILAAETVRSRHDASGRGRMRTAASASIGTINGPICSRWATASAMKEEAS